DPSASFGSAGAPLAGGATPTSDRRQPHALVVQGAAFSDVGQGGADQGVGGVAGGKMATLGDDGDVGALAGVGADANPKRAQSGFQGGVGAVGQAGGGSH